MTVADLTMHPFQRFDLERNPFWQGVEFRNDDNSFFEEQTRHLETAFHRAVERNSLRTFIGEYTKVSAQMLGRATDRSVLFPLLGHSLVYLIHYFYFLRLRTRPFLCERNSVYSWMMDPDLIARAREAAAVMERENIETQDYNLNDDRALKAWLVKNIQPILQDYVGFTVGWPWAHIRYADATRHGKAWAFRYKQHPYGNFHFDQVCYSLPVIIYLDEVDEGCGPFTYVDGADKMPQNPVLRAYHQALYHDCKICCYEDAHLRGIGKLPSVFRGGDLIGSYTGPKPFESHRVVELTGSTGHTVLFEGFQLLHSGGHPKTGSRKALFVAFRFPRKKFGDFVARAVAMIWRRRVARALARISVAHD